MTEQALSPITKKKREKIDERMRKTKEMGLLRRCNGRQEVSGRSRMENFVCDEKDFEMGTEFKRKPVGQTFGSAILCLGTSLSSTKSGC